ncbi:MAG TPA: site-2 protease family protein [Opitutaceae bacterium]|jgi:regulator of sigma E protease|nr:site-2 protease family protein [Opitutaceae bacterium]
MLHSFVSLATQDIWAALLIAFFFGGSIFVHELGHFLAARMTGVHVERFSIGFGPAICSWKGKSGVEYRLSWLPLGGYVLLPQLADLRAVEGESSSDVSALPPPSYPVKMLVFVAGAFFNVLFAFGLATIVYLVGEPAARAQFDTLVGYVMDKITLPNGQAVASPAAAAGVQPGDIIRSIDGTSVHDWNDVTALIKLSGSRTPAGKPVVHFVVDRNGRRIPLTLYPLILGEVNPTLSGSGVTEWVASKPLPGGADNSRQIGISGGDTLLVASVEPGSAAAKAGFQADDQIQAVDGTRVYSVFTIFDAFGRDIGKAVRVDVLRGGHLLHLSVTSVAPPPAAVKSGRSTAALASGFTFKFPTVIVHRSPFRQVWEELVTTVRTVVSLINPHSDIGLSKLSGVIGIVQFYQQIAPEGLIPVLALTILINVNLAILNLLPVPILDGGQMLFATIAAIRGRSLPVNFIAAIQSIFLMLIVMVMVYVGWFDILRWRHG